MQKKIHFDSIDDVIRFSNIAVCCPFDIDIGKNSHEMIDAKSIMGIMSLDLSDPLIVDYEGQDQNLEEYLKAHEKYITTY